jgi:hypothetical protein
MEAICCSETSDGYQQTASRNVPVLFITTGVTTSNAIHTFLHSFALCVLVSVRGGPQACETWRLPRLLEDRLTDGGEALPQEGSCNSLLLETELTSGRKCGRKDSVHCKVQSPYRESNPRPSSLYIVLQPTALPRAQSLGSYLLL